MKKFKKIMLLALAAAMCVALLVPALSSAAASSPLENGAAYGVKGYLADYLNSPVWRYDSVGAADRTANGSLGEMIGATGTEFADAKPYAGHVGEAGPKDIYTGYQSTSYWRTSPTTNGYFNVQLLNNKQQIISAGGMVWEFDLYVEKVQIAGADTPNDATDDRFESGISRTGVTFGFFTTGAAAGGMNFGNTGIRLQDSGKVGITYNGASVNTDSLFEVGEWVHVTFAFDATSSTECVLHVYTSEAGNPNAERKLAFSKGLGSGGSEGVIYPTTVRIMHYDANGYGTYRLDNIIVYGGNAIRNPFKVKNMGGIERFVYLSNAIYDTSIDSATRFSAYSEATQLLDTAKTSTDAEVVTAVQTFESFIASDGLAALENEAKISNAAEYKRLAEAAAALSVDGETRTIANITNRETAHKAATDYLGSLSGFIAENADYEAANSILAAVSSKIEADKNAKTFMSSMDKFYQNYEYGFVSSMRSYYEAAAEVYASIPSVEAYAESDANTAKYAEALTRYGSAEAFLNNLEMQANSTRIGQIVDLLEEGKDNWATDPKYKRMWNAAYEILKLNGHYDPNHGSIQNDIERFFAAGGPHEYFWGEIQKEHVSILRAKLDDFNKEDATYIEKAGICTFVDYYMKDNEQFIDSSNSEVFELVAIAKGYSEQLGVLKDDYKLLLVQNSQKFVNTVNLMLECKSYAEIKALHDEAKEYYYAMDIPDEATMAKVLAYEAMEDTLISIESDCLIFLSVAEALPYAANDSEVYAALVAGFGCYDNIDESYDGITDAKAVYSASFDAYSAKVDAMNEELFEVADVACSVRSFFGINTIVDFVRSLFD